MLLYIRRVIKMKRIVAVVLTFVMLASTFTVMKSSEVEAKTKSGYYFAMIQKKKSYFGYVKKVKIVANKKVVPVKSKTTEQATIAQGGEQATTVQQTTKQQTKVVYGKGAAKIITYGTFMYRKTDKGASKIIKAKKRTFIIPKKCKFYDKCWKGKKKPKKISRNKAFKKFKKIKKTSLNECEFQVKNGKVKVIKFGRG